MKNFLAFIIVAVLFFAGFVYFGIFKDKKEETEPVKVEQSSTVVEKEKEEPKEEPKEEMPIETEEELKEEVVQEEAKEEPTAAPSGSEGKVNESLPEENKNQVTAIFSGAIDSHSIEVNVNGNYQTFSFGENLQDKIFSIPPGKEVFITFENGNSGEKIIKSIQEK